MDPPTVGQTIDRRITGCSPREHACRPFLRVVLIPGNRPIRLGNDMAAVGGLKKNVERTWQQTGRPSDRPVINATQPGCALETDLLSQLFAEREVEAEGEDAEDESLSEASESDENSDDEDIFDMKAATQETLSTEYQAMWLYRWQLAVGRLSLLLRDDVLLPLNPQDTQGEKVWTDVQAGIVLPPWHCAFLGCGAAEPTASGC